MLPFSNRLEVSFASTQLRRFKLLTWLRFGLALILTFSLALTFGGASKDSNDLSPTFIAGLYALTSITALWLLTYSPMYWQNQLFGQLIVDVVLIALLVASLGGGSGGYAILFMMPIAAAASLMSWSAAMFICSVSVLSLLTDGLRRSLLGQKEVDWVVLGLLGFAGFALMSILRFAAQRTERVEALARQSHTQAIMMQEISEKHLTEDTLGWLVLNEHHTVQLLNAPTRLLAWQAGRILDIGQTIRVDSPLAAWLGALNQVGEITIDWPKLGAGNRADEPFTTERLHIKAANLPHLDNYTALTLELESTRQARARDIQLASMGRLSASIAHEIRNPLAAISQAAELLQESSALPASDGPLLAMLVTNAQRIDRIVHNLLAWSRGVQASPVTFHPQLLVAQLALQIAVGLKLNDGQLLIEPLGSNFTQVQFDEDHLYQILSNLLSNAARFASGKPDSICISLRSRGRFVALLVLDDGPAVDAQVAQHLFEPFQTASKQGTGLGLFLCREYAQANKGGLQLMNHDPLAAAGMGWINAPYTKAFVLNMPITALNLAD